jgi:hypothetical protein
VNITNPTRWLVKFDVLICYIHLQVNITKSKFSKWRLAVLLKLVIKILKQSFASGSVIIGEYSPRFRLGEYSPIITSLSANNC